MIHRFENFIKENKLFNKSDKLLLTVSGGVDSVVMAELCKLSGFTFGICHCNFQLREKDSDNDHNFVEHFAKKYQVPFYSIKFNTKEEQLKNHTSTQMEARNLRYQYFHDIAQEHAYNYILTAHHLDDAIETFFVNLIRGTGIEGLTGIPIKRGKIVRPLLFATKKEIENFATKCKLEFRHDISNNDAEKYLRNSIRLKIIPLFEELNPSIRKNMKKNIQRLQAVSGVYQNQIEKILPDFICREGDRDIIDLEKIYSQSNSDDVLFGILKKYNFTFDIIQQLLNNINATSGSKYFSESHQILLDRKRLIVEPFKDKALRMVDYFTIQKSDVEIVFNGNKFRFETNKVLLQNTISSELNIAFLDFECLEFPLKLRYWRNGDYFFPLGMKSKKKLSDFFIDKKVDLFQKKKIPIFLNKDEIVWIAGMRIDNRYRVTEKTKTVFKIEQIL